MKIIEQLKQIANNLGGVELLSKDDKKTLYDLGLVWPAYGSTSRKAILSCQQHSYSTILRDPKG